MLRSSLQFFIILSICFSTNLYAKYIFIHNGSEYHFKTIKENNKEFIALNDLLEPLKIKFTYNRVLHKVSFEYNKHIIILSPISNALCIDGKVAIYDQPLIYKRGTFYLEQDVVLKTVIPVLSYDFVKDLIIIDAGHGGKGEEGEGAKAEFGGVSLVEKDIVLKFSKFLGDAFLQHGYLIKYTREKDEYIGLKDRIDLANNNRARLFISLHVNSSVSDQAKGFEVYYLSEKAGDSQAELVSMTENKVFKDEMSKSDGDISQIVKSMFTSSRIDESSKLALHVSKTILSGKNRGVKKAPFYVLAGTYMPSVLIELGFLSNQEDFNNLKSDAWLKSMALKLAEAIESYLDNSNRSTIYEG